MLWFTSRFSLLGLLIPCVALAHTGVGETTGFVHGLTHPISGVDHLLAMVAIGMWAIQIGGRGMWVLPACFVSMMIIGSILGFSGIPVPFIEEGILASILILGILIAAAFKSPLVYSAVIAGIFAIFHGYAHGAEMPATSGTATYMFGFTCSTALLHLSGLGIGALLQATNLKIVGRFAGGAVALGGIYLAVV